MEVDYKKIYESIVLRHEPFIYQTVNQQKMLMTITLIRELNGLECTIRRKGRRISSMSLSSDNMERIDLVFEILKNLTFCLNKYCLKPGVSTETINDNCYSCHMMSLDKTECDSDCAICLEKNNVHSLELYCGHIFHKECLSKTKKTQCEFHCHIKCSLCRKQNKVENNMSISTLGDNGFCVDIETSDDED